MGHKTHTSSALVFVRLIARPRRGERCAISTMRDSPQASHRRARSGNLRQNRADGVSSPIRRSAASRQTHEQNRRLTIALNERLQVRQRCSTPDSVARRDCKQKLAAGSLQSRQDTRRLFRAIRPT